MVNSCDHFLCFPAEAPDLWSIRSVTVELLGGEPARRDPGRVKESSGPWIEDLDALHRQAELRGDRARGGSMADQRAHAAALRRYANAALDRVDLEQLSRLVDDELIPLTATLDDPVERARALRTQAAVRLRQGDSNAALEILRTLVLPVIENDDTERAITLGQIAAVLQVRGELDEALRIRREEVRPVYERVGDVRAKAVTMGRIADILQARGELDEALRIHREDELPVYERLGDVREKAVTMGQIAGILKARGELDEALRILHQDLLLVYERLGDVRSKAVTMGKIADILKARGELDEALRIRREDALPVYERLGGRDLVVGLANLGILLIERGLGADLIEARRHLERAATMAASMHIPLPDHVHRWLASDAGRS